MAMRPTMIPTFQPQTPYGVGLSNLAQIFTAGPSPYEMQANQALIDQRNAAAQKTALESEALRAKAAAASSIPGLFEQAYAPAPMLPVDDPLGGIGETPDPTFSRDQAIIDTLPKLAGAVAQSGNLTDIGKIILGMIGNAPGATDDMVVRSLAGAGKPIGVNDAVSLGGQADVAARNQAGEMAQIFARPAEVSAGGTMAFHPDDPRAAGGMLQGRDTESTEKARILQGESEAVRRSAVAGSGGTPRNYIGPDGSVGVTLDGLTDAATQAPIPAGSQVSTAQIQTDAASNLTNSTRAGLEKQGIETGNFRDMIGMARSVAGDERNFGASGFLRGTVQDAIQQGNALAQTLGAQANKTQQAVVAGGHEIGLDNFDTDLSQIEMMENMLAYQLARFREPGGRLSDNDFKAAKKDVGLGGLLANQAKFMARLDLLEQVISGVDQRATDTLGGTPEGGGDAKPTHRYVPGRGIVPVE